MTVDRWSVCWMCVAESGVWLRCGNRKTGFAVGTGRRYCSWTAELGAAARGANLVGAESCYCFPWVCWGCGKGARTSMEIGLVYSGTRWVCGCHSPSAGETVATAVLHKTGLGKLPLALWPIWPFKISDTNVFIRLFRATCSAHLILCFTCLLTFRLLMSTIVDVPHR